VAKLGPPAAERLASKSPGGPLGRGGSVRRKGGGGWPPWVFEGKEKERR